MRRALPRQRRAALGRRRGPPLSEAAVRGVADAVRPYAFDRIYGGWWTPVLRAGARDTVQRSASRYIEHLRGTAG